MWEATNQVELEGIVSRGSVPMYKSKDLWYYKMYIKVDRTSGIQDEIPVYSFYSYSFKPGERVRVKGQMKSWNFHDNGKSHLMIYVDADTVFLLDEECEDVDHNQISLTGTICKINPMRRTPKGRIIMDLMVAVNHPNGRSSYMPCVVWEHSISEVQQYVVGDQVELTARFQSRNYVKKIDGNEEEKTAYELSVNCISKKVA